MANVPGFVLLVAGLIGATSACHPAMPATTTNAAPMAGSSVPGGIRRTLIDSRPATDLPGWETRLYLIEYAPGAAAPTHTHPTVGVGLVLSGRFESAFGDEPVVVVRAGQGFIDQASAVHRVFRNPSPDQELRFVVAYTIRAGEAPFRLGAAEAEAPSRRGRVTRLITRHFSTTYIEAFPCDPPQHGVIPQITAALR